MGEYIIGNLVLIIMTILIFFVIYKSTEYNKKSKKINKVVVSKKEYDKKYLTYIEYDSNIGSYDILSSNIEEKIREHDYNFKKEDVLNFVENYLNCELVKKIKLNDNLYDDVYINKGKKLTEILNISNEIDKINVNFISISKYNMTKEEENLEIIVRIDLYDMIQNSNDKFYDKRILITLNRKFDNIIYDEKMDLQTLTCNSCGGKLKIDGKILKCEFCGVNSILKYGDWKISNVIEIE